ncbi:MAG TPA: S9 family peptidase [Rhodanobacteraceae bacterium]|nr:S9 family peptidase [Rhodanobacteraceae bacterium]
MKRIHAVPALLLAVAAAPSFAAMSPAVAPHPFNAHDLVMMERVSDPQLSPDGNRVAFGVRITDYEANKGRNGVWVLPLDKAGAKPQRLTDLQLNASSGRFSPDGRTLYFLAAVKGTSQLWAMPSAGGKPHAVTHLPVDIDTYRISQDGKLLLFSAQVFEDCRDLACTKERLDAQAKNKATGRVYDRLFVRHWDVWSDHRRSQLFVMPLAGGDPVQLTRGIDGDVPSKPDGDESDYAFSPDGKTVYFDVRIAGKTEAWSTNFDVYSVPVDGSSAPHNLTAENPAWDAYPVPSPDGKTLYYLAMKTPGFEADRFAIMALDLATGQKREVDPQWDRSPGSLQVSADDKTLFATADDRGQHPLFAIDVASGKVTQLLGDGTVTGFDVSGSRIVAARADFRHPADLYVLNTQGGALAQVTHFNADVLRDIRFGDAQWFTFKGAKDEEVQGYVIKPADFQPGRKYPVAFLIHGGPQNQWQNEFHYRWNPEVYAGAGFAVVSINFHGSTGYGQAFTNAISGDWGGAPLEDLQKGWQYALDNFSFLDGNEACALGASYGGYMVYWMAGVWNRPWKCLVDHDGVFDTRMMYYATEELWFEEHENGGTQFEHPENYEKFNPLDHVKDWRVPMLVVHSGHDYRIPETQGLGAFTALQRRGIPSELLYFPDESHWVQKPQNSILWHDTVIGWLKKWTSTDSKEAANK